MELAGEGGACRVRLPGSFQVLGSCFSVRGAGARGSGLLTQYHIVSHSITLISREISFTVQVQTVCRVSARRGGDFRKKQPGKDGSPEGPTRRTTVK